MKTTPKSFLFLAGAALGLASASTLTAQDSVSTDPVGYVSVGISEGYNPIGITFVKEQVLSSEVTASSEGSLTLAVAPSLGAGKYFVEVLSSAADIVGERIDISSVNGNVLTLDTSAPHNTISDGSLVVSESIVAIRSHFTIGDFDALIADSVNSDDTFDPSKSDQILLFVDGGFKTHINFENEWYENFGDFNVATDKILAPGSGFFFFRNPNAGDPSNLTATFTGAVRMNNYVQRLAPGYQFVANGYPISASPADYNYSGILEASTNFDSSESDLILTWDNGFKTHLLYDDGTGTTEWYQNFGDFNVVEESNLLTASNAVFVFIKDTGHVLEVVRPF